MILTTDLMAVWVTAKVNLIYRKKNAHSSEKFSGEWAFCIMAFCICHLPLLAWRLPFWERSFRFFIWQVSALSVPHKIWTPAKLFQRLLLFKAQLLYMTATIRNSWPWSSWNRWSGDTLWAIGTIAVFALLMAAYHPWWSAADSMLLRR